MTVLAAAFGCAAWVYLAVGHPLNAAFMAGLAIFTYLLARVERWQERRP